MAATAAMLRALGVEVEEHPDGLTVRGGRGARGGVVESHGDHRIAMAGAVCALARAGRDRDPRHPQRRHQLPRLRAAIGVARG